MRDEVGKGSRRINSKTPLFHAFHIYYGVRDKSCIISKHRFICIRVQKLGGSSMRIKKKTCFSILTYVKQREHMGEACMPCKTKL